MLQCCEKEISPYLCLIYTMCYRVNDVYRNVINIVYFLFSFQNRWKLGVKLTLKLWRHFNSVIYKLLIQSTRLNTLVSGECWQMNHLMLQFLRSAMDENWHFSKD